MSGTISTRWFFSDWLSDTALRACSLAARGLWKDMLCIMAANKGRHYGHLLIGGKPPDDEMLGRMVGAKDEDISGLIGELERNGVFSRTNRRVIYSRRLVRSAKNSENGKKGGNPKLLENKENQNPVKAHTPEPVPEPEVSKTLFDQIPVVPDSGDGWPADYEQQFWTAYPLKVSKAAAMKALRRVRAAKLVLWDEIFGKVATYAAWLGEESPGQWRPRPKHPATWVNGECWKDELPRAAPRSRRRSFADIARGDTE